MPMPGLPSRDADDCTVTRIMTTNVKNEIKAIHFYVMNCLYRFLSSIDFIY